MARSLPRAGPEALRDSNAPVTLALLGANLIFNMAANAGFKLAAMSGTWRCFLAWQVAGNLAGFAAVLTLTGLLRHLPLHVAHPVTAGLAALGVQIVVARLVFDETISSTQWLGTLFVAAGIVLIGGG